MATPHLLRLLIPAALAALYIGTARSGGRYSWTPVNKELVEERIGGGELELDTEVSRRMLATSDYISYSALQANSVPCSRRGASYYNCQPGAEANPYIRSCTAATQCRS